jgi:ABC-2 type transport system permease protein
MNPVIRQLVIRDLRLNSHVMLAMLAAGGIGIVLMGTGRIGFGVGGVLFLTANIAGGVFAGIACIVQERKDQSVLFALSLPISPAQFALAKLVSALTLYFIPWFVLTVVACGGPLLSDTVPDGAGTFTLLIQGAALAATTGYLAMISVWASDAMMGVAILGFNVAFSLFITTINQPEFRAPLMAERIAWTEFAVMSLLGELLLIVLVLSIAWRVLSRRRDFV